MDANSSPNGAGSIKPIYFILMSIQVLIALSCNLLGDQQTPAVDSAENTPTTDRNDTRSSELPPLPATNPPASGGSAGGASATPEANKYAGPQLQTPTIRQDTPPDVLEHITWEAGGGGGSLCGMVPSQAPVIAMTNTGSIADGETYVINSLYDELVYSPMQGDIAGLPGLCISEPELLEKVAAISPDGTSFQPYTQYYPDFGEAHLPFDALNQPGLWHLTVLAPSRHFDISIVIPEIDQPIHVEDDSGAMVWVGGFDTRERIVGAAFDNNGFVGSFEFQADERGLALVTNPYPGSHLVLTGANRNYSAYFVPIDKTEIVNLLYNTYWGGSGTTEVNIPPSINNVQFCDVSCGNPGAQQLSLFPAKTKQIYVRWNYSGMHQGLHYTREWFNRGVSWIKYQCTWQGPESGSQEVSLTEPGGLRSGDWELVITVEGQEIARASLNVAGNFEYWAPAGSQPCKDF